MNRTLVDMKTMLWDKDITPEFYFMHMPYMMKHFEFICSEKPRFYFYQEHHMRPQIPDEAVKIFMAVENRRINMESCDWAFGYDHEEEIDNPHYMRFPQYARLGGDDRLIKPPRTDSEIEEIMKSKTRFCAFIYSNPGGPHRTKFFEALSKYKHVDAPGGLCNNMDPLPITYPDRYETKLLFLQSYKFVVAFENASFPGYCDEKIIHPMMVNAIPIYWGNPVIHRDFNPKSFINAHDDMVNRTQKELIEFMVDRVIQMDRDDDLWARTLREPWYPGNQVTAYSDGERLLKRFKQIFTS